MLALRCGAQNYEWGREASCSEVAALARANNGSIDETKPFAELWMGTHSNCPSMVSASGDSLQAWIEAHPESLGSAVTRRFGTQLPFLFKVLSVRKALSIQSHPDKALAERLHAEHPKLYPDDNHKPEMALALTEFEALCGFCSLEELQEALRDVPELGECMGPQALRAVQGTKSPDAEVLKAAFTSIMTCDSLRVQESVASLVTRLQGQRDKRKLTAKEALALRLNSQYPGGDVGVLSCFFLNLLHMKPGQAIYLPANVPHAYLDGEILECMAASDNVIRAGLTPKFKDTSVLCSSLVYEQGLPEVLDGDTENVPGCTRVYRPPFEEFEMWVMDFDGSSSGSLEVPASEGPSILLVLRGQGSARASQAAIKSKDLAEEVEMAKGTILFVPAGTQISVSPAAGDGKLSICSAVVNSTFLQLQRSLHSNGSSASTTPLEAAASPR